VIGSKPAVAYPRLPPDNPFSSDISGVEPPLGYEINSQEPTGNYHEIELNAASSIPLDAAGAPEASSVCSTPSAAVLSPVVDGVSSSNVLTRGRRL
jgi:hypothetical protein